MIEMAETASVTAGSHKRSSQEEAGSSQSETSLTKSTENLIQDTPSVCTFSMEIGLCMEIRFTAFLM